MASIITATKDVRLEKNTIVKLFAKAPGKIHIVMHLSIIFGSATEQTAPRLSYAHHTVCIAAILTKPRLKDDKTGGLTFGFLD